MDHFQSLLKILERLLGPDGCPWDREQTLQSMRASLLEETYEVIEAIDLNNDALLKEELGDLLFNVLFLCQLAAKEGKFTLEEVIQQVSEKLVRRHPHIFGETHVQTSEEVLMQWEAIKQTEEKSQIRESALDDIPKHLPSLARAQKMGKKFTKHHFIVNSVDLPLPEDQAGEDLWELVQQMARQGIQAEQALNKRLSELEAEFREWERAGQD